MKTLILSFLFLVFPLFFNDFVLHAAPYYTHRAPAHGTRSYWNHQGGDYGRGSYARYYGRNYGNRNYNYRMNKNNPWFRNPNYYGVGYPTAYDYNWYGFGGVDYQNYWDAYPSSFTNWTYPSYPYTGKYYRSSSPIFR